jgi:hypothetical protein
VQELQAIAAERTKVTVSSLIQEAEEVRELAVTERQLGAANTAIVTKAKLAGLWVDRSEVGEVDLTRMSKEELKEYLCERYGEERGNEFFGWLKKMGYEPSTENQVIYSRSSLKNRLPRARRRR